MSVTVTHISYMLIKFKQHSISSLCLKISSSTSYQSVRTHLINSQVRNRKQLGNSWDRVSPCRCQSTL